MSEELIARVRAINEAMTPEQRKAMIDAQRESWIRAFAPCEHGDPDWETCPGCLSASAPVLDAIPEGVTFTSTVEALQENMALSKAGICPETAGELPCVIEPGDRLPGALHEALNSWSFNVMLECGREDDPLGVVIGGAVLDLRDLDRILTWAMGSNGLSDTPANLNRNEGTGA